MYRVCTPRPICTGYVHLGPYVQGVYTRSICTGCVHLGPYVQGVCTPRSICKIHLYRLHMYSNKGLPVL